MASINTDEVFKIIKKQNGESFAKVLRTAVLLDTPNLKHILEYAGKNPDDARSLIPVLSEIRAKSQEAPQIKYEIRDPIKLLDDAGYDAFYVNNLHQQNSIEKYFEPYERLCTFNDQSRYKDYYIIHAVKKNVDDIKRGNPPKREDEYGTSVISIQIDKTGGFISIKNRYNHTVDNPDATFNNNPDNIIPGLTESLKNKFGVGFMTQSAQMPDNFRMVNNQLVRFNYEIDNVYYDEKYYFSGSEITKLNPDYEVMIDNVILDIRTGTIRTVNDGTKDLANILNNEISGVRVEKDKSTGETIIYITDENKNAQELVRTKNGCMTSLCLYKTAEVGNQFPRANKTLKKIYAPNLKKIGSRCFHMAENLENLYIPQLKEMGLDCFARAEKLSELNAPKLKNMGNGCFERARKIKKLYIPELEKMGSACFLSTDELLELNAPKLKKMGVGCFGYNAKLEKLYIPQLEEIMDGVFANIKHCQELNAPKLKQLRHNFTYGAPVIRKVILPELKEIETDCFNDTKIIKYFYAPKLKITKYTPKCVLRAIKLQKFKAGIKKLLKLSKHNSGENNNIVIPQNNRDL